MLFDPNLTLDQQREELEALLAPISAENPAGISPDATKESDDRFQQLKKQFTVCVRAESTNSARRNANQEEEPVPWQSSVTESLEYIASSSKNLSLATLVAEGGLRLLGPRGLALGLELMTGLVERYWPNVHPEGPATNALGKKDIATKKFAAWHFAYTWPARLDERLDALISLTPTTTFKKYNEASTLDTLDAEIRRTRIAGGAKTVAMIQGDFLQSPPRVKLLFEDLELCRSALDRLAELVTKKCVSPDPDNPFLLPDFHSTAAQIGWQLNVVRKLAPAGLLPQPAGSADAVPSSKPDDSHPHDQQMIRPSDGEMSRDAAFAQLTQLAAFFRRTEPHSPISYALEQTVRWGRMSLPDLLTELIAHAESRKTLFERTGLPLTEEKKA